MPRARLAFAVLAAFWVASVSSPAGATASSALLARGKQLYEDGLFERSLKVLARAERKSPQPRELAEIRLYQGLNHHVLDRREEAERLFVEALRADPALSLDPTKFKPGIVALLHRVREGVRGELQITADRPGVQVALDGDPIGAAPLRRAVAVGTHRVTARHEGRTSQREVLVRWGQTAAVSFTFATSETSQRRPVRGAHEPRERPRRRGRRIWTWVAAGAAVAAGGVGLGFTLSASSDFDEYSSTKDPQRFDELGERIPRKETIAGVLYGVAGALAVTAGVLYWLEGRRPRPRREVFAAPIVGPDLAGWQVGGRF